MCMNSKKISKIFGITLVLSLITTNNYAQTCITNYIQQPTRPDTRYQDMGAEVKDKVTGLIWQRCSVGQTWDGSTCTGTATKHTWQQALTVAKNLGNGYRLPNIKELQSLVERQCYSPSINSKTFPNTPSSNYWSSSHSSHGVDLAWKVNFDQGYSSSATHSFFSYAVRAVRSE